jgi:hypothetical protein
MGLNQPFSTNSAELAIQERVGSRQFWILDFANLVIAFLQPWA